MIPPIDYSELCQSTDSDNVFAFKRRRSSLTNKGCGKIPCSCEDFTLNSKSNSAFLANLCSRRQDDGDGKVWRLIKRIVEKRTVQSFHRVAKKRDGNYERHLSKAMVSFQLNEVMY